MSDRVTGYRNIPAQLVNPATASLMACTECAFVWDLSEDVDKLDGMVHPCPYCKSTKGTEPLYDCFGESNNTDWPAA